MKIAFFSDVFYPEISGITDSILLTGSELARRGHKVHFYVPFYTDHEYKIANVNLREPNLPSGAEIIRLPSKRFDGPTGMGRAIWPNLLDGVRTRERYDIAHVHTFFGAGIDALVFAKRYGVPLLGTNHTYIESFLEYSPIRLEWIKKVAVFYVRWFYDRLRLVSTPSHFLTHHMQETGSRVPILTVSNPIAPEFFESSFDKEKLKKDYGFKGPVILYAGRFAAEKNVMTLLNAFIELTKMDKKTELVFVGMGPERDNLISKIRRAKLKERVHIMGPYLGENKQPLYDLFHLADVFAFPSTSDTQSMVTLQAFAATTPAVVARIGPLPELVSENRGLTFEPENVAELTEALHKLIRDPVLCNIMGKNGRTFAEKYSVSAVADQWEKLYNQVIKQEVARKKSN